MKTSIKLKIYSGFLSLAALFVVNAIFTIFILYRSKVLADHIRDVVDPSLRKLDDFHDILMQSKMYATNWVFLRYSQEDKDSLVSLHNGGYNGIKSDLQKLSLKWRGNENRQKLASVFSGFEDLLVVEKRIMNCLQSFPDYDDPVKKFEAEKLVEDEVIPRTASLVHDLFVVIRNERVKRLAEEDKLERAFKIFWGVIVFLAIVIIGIGLILSKYLTKIIVRPIKQMSLIVHELGRGVTNKIEDSHKEDEIGKMVIAVNQLSDKLSYTAHFAQKIGERKFDEPFEPLSEADTLGKALVRMRENLKSVDESLNLAQHTAQLGSWEFKADTGKTFWSDELYQILEKDPSAVTASPEAFIDCLYAEDKEQVSKLVYNSLKNGQPFICECRITGKKGNIKTVSLHTNVNIDEKGEMVKLYGIVQDITERKKAEQELEEKNYELQQKNKELEQFAYVTSHDLQEPLRTISSFVDHFQKLYKDKLDDTGGKFLHYIVQATDRMKTLIQDLLDYSRIGRKKELASIDCNAIVNTVLADLNTAIQESGAEVKTQKLPVINGYTTEMKQLFQNLITNAIKFRKKETRPLIQITSRRVDGGYEFKVEDNGIGIPEEHNERIFEIFQRLHTRTEYEGSGIGLSHCKKIVELHGGRIWVKSKPGEGSAFHFTLPENNN